MPTTVSAALTNIREKLDELSAGQWTNNSLAMWLNEGCKDVSRRTFCIQDRFTLPVTQGQLEYPLTSATTISDLLSGITGIDCTYILQIDRAEWLPSDGRVLFLSPRGYDAMDNIWTINQNSVQGEPAVYACLGTPPFLQLKIYPSPNQSASTVRLYVRRSSRTVATSDTTQVVDLPEGWVDLAYDYVVYRALLKDNQQQWQSHYQFYEQRIQDMINMIDNYVASNETMTPEGTMLPWYAVPDRWY